jgi:hypothetical protein
MENLPPKRARLVFTSNTKVTIEACTYPIQETDTIAFLYMAIGYGFLSRTGKN